jgi:hypothetical protein
MLTPAASYLQLSSGHHQGCLGCGKYIYMEPSATEDVDIFVMLPVAAGDIRVPEGTRLQWS